MIRSFLITSIVIAATICHFAEGQEQPANWGGFCLGATFGYSWDSFDFESITESFGPNSLNGAVPNRSFEGDKSFLAGGQIGYNQQFGTLVIGLEGDSDWISHRIGFSEDLFFFNSPFPIGSILHANHSAKLDSVSSLRPKVGIGWQRFLIYATGGLAVGDLTLRTNDLSFVLGGHPGQIGAASDSGLALGWTAGGGAEWLITPAVSIAAEYRHLDIGGSYSPAGQAFHAHGHVEFNDDEVSLRLNLHLNAFFAR